MKQQEKRYTQINELSLMNTPTPINWMIEIAKGAKAFNRFREKNPDKTPRLSGEYLGDMNLEDMDLQDADLSASDLSRSNLMNANLRYANLKGTNFFDADLDGANLYRADLRGVKLEGESLNGVDAIYANLDGAHISFRGKTVIVGYLTPDEWEAVKQFREAIR